MVIAGFVLVVILFISYRVDFKLLKKAPMGTRVIYGTIFTVGFVLIACYTINPDLPNLLSMIEQTIPTWQGMDSGL